MKLYINNIVGRLNNITYSSIFYGLFNNKDESVGSSINLFMKNKPGYNVEYIRTLEIPDHMIETVYQNIKRVK